MFCNFYYKLFENLTSCISFRGAKIHIIILITHNRALYLTSFLSNCDFVVIKEIIHLFFGKIIVISDFIVTFARKN